MRSRLVPRDLGGPLAVLVAFAVISSDVSQASERDPGLLWSQRSIARPATPRPRDTSLVRNSIDAFVLARLADEDLERAPEADRRTLIRRLSFDLVGLPPSAEEIERFESDPEPDAHERLVDRLLASPQLGVRWARHWLDVVRFAETNGYERDATKPHAWRYRDWVVDALNEDLPYDRFVTEQLAGDEIDGRDEQSLIATGMLRLGTWDDEPNVPGEYTYERLEDLVHTTTSSFLALTVKCARCHDHKFDPIPQRDYYRVASAFWAGFVQPGNGAVLGGPSAEKLGADVLGWTDRGRDVEPLRVLKSGDVHQPLEVASPGALSYVRQLSGDFTPPPDHASTTTRRLQLARWITDSRNPLTARVIVNRIWQHHFGKGIVTTPNNFGSKGAPPSHPELLDWLASELIDSGWSLKHVHRLIVSSSTYRMASTHVDEETYRERDPRKTLLWRFERRRLEAEALRDSMLAASGELALELGGPSFFPAIPAGALVGLSRKGASVGSSPEPERRRRSLYIFTKRSLLSPLMTAFDFCDTTTSCGKRDVTTVATQALALLNGEFTHSRSAALARRVALLATEDSLSRAETAWRLALGRSPSARETRLAVAHLEAQAAHFRASDQSATPLPVAAKLALASLCHVLINSNEFLHVD